MNKLLIMHLVLITVLINSQSVFGYDDQRTHPDITKKAVEKSMLKTNLHELLGPEFSAEYDTLVNGVSVINLIREGSIAEDSEMCRRGNHFHNPLLPWGESYNKDMWWPKPGCVALGWFARYSAVTWATGFLAPPPAGSKGSYYSPAPQNWDVARRYYYLALTSDVYRTLYFMKTFNAIGQVLHLLQDMAVPAHTRNDFASHLVGGTGQPYEAYVKVNPELVSDSIKTPSFLNTKVTDYWDTDRYNGSNPSTLMDIGLSEFSNTNYFSDYTIPNNGTTAEHGFPYPYLSSANVSGPSYQICSQEVAPGIVVKYVSRKNGQPCPSQTNGASIDHFAVYSLMNPSGYADANSSAYIWLDDNVHKQYAQELLPRAIGYSAALLGYFFRGDMKLDYRTDNSPGYVVVNNTNEEMGGLFSVYYDTASGQRNIISSGTATLSPGALSDPFEIIPPQEAKKPGEYILVFKGKMGNEEGAVAGKVFSRILDITLPDSGVYALVNTDTAPVQFVQIKAKIRNTAADESIGGGTIQAVAKYKNSVDDMRFRNAVSTPLSIGGLSGTTEFTFDFSAQPIPVNATDLYLQVIFKGQMGDDLNATAIGMKDISEPTPIDLFNNMDRVCIMGAWYYAGSTEAITKMNQENMADEWDVYPHAATDIYVKISSSNNPQDASSTNYDYSLPELGVNAFKRLMYILTDKTYSYSVYSSGRDLMPGVDPWEFLAGVETYTGTAVKNQTDWVHDPALCDGETSCYKTVTSDYYSYRGNLMWWGGSLIFVNDSCPESVVCTD